MSSSSIVLLSVKHLNPRQGITTRNHLLGHKLGDIHRVKHLNPRQGITTDVWAALLVDMPMTACETPKSPPGDYNTGRGAGAERRLDIEVV